MGSATTPLIPPPQREIALGDRRKLVLGVQLGRGSCATVYRAVLHEDFGVERSVAVKLFDVLASDEHDAVATTLARAARAGACVRHPNVVQVYSFGMLPTAQPFVVMELVEGRTLADMVESYRRSSQRVPLDLALFIGMEIADALAGARLATTPDNVRLGVVHGELSPNDVLLSWGGEVKVGDFGIAAATRAASSIRSVKTLAQRIRALAPEVARGNVGDARSDVFSLGVLLREMLVGPRFGPSISDKEALEQARDGVVQPLMFEPHLSADLRVILARALDRDAARRFPHAGALGYELRRVALAMGVGDGRSFLRNALPRVFAGSIPDDDEITDELRLGQRPSGVVDRFARLREGGLTDRESGTIRRALRFAADHVGDEECLEPGDCAFGDDD